MVLPVPPNSSRSVDEDGVDHSNLHLRLGPNLELRNSTSHSSHSSNAHVGDGGGALYRAFLEDDFRRRNLPEPARVLQMDSPFHIIPEPTEPDLVWAINQLRILSEEFSTSPQRAWVEEQAARVPLDNLDFQAFSDLLYGLFQQGGVTWERVVILFYFCADLAARAFREKLPNELHKIVEWSLSFIGGATMMRWVAANGGWAGVLQRSIGHAFKVAQIGFFMLGVIAVATYIWKSRF